MKTTTPRPNETPWTEADAETLAKLWDIDKLPALEIARILGRGKGSIVGKANRMKLTRRENPIKPNPDGPKRKRLTRAELRAKNTIPVVDIPKAQPGSRGCCWPMWGNKQKPTHAYCGHSAVGVYCDHHRAIGTVPKLKKTADAEAAT